jgi:hypothetical protein
VCTGTVTWLLCDYGEVLSLAQPADDRARVEAAAGRGGPDFWADYWAHRPDYDRGDLSVADYWTTVAGREFDEDDLGRLVLADVASWLHPDGRALAGAGPEPDESLPPEEPPGIGPPPPRRAPAFVEVSARLVAELRREYQGSKIGELAEVEAWLASLKPGRHRPRAGSR